MTLPLSIDDVYYFNDSFVGDLVVTRGVIYFFPHAEGETQRVRKADLLLGLMEHAGWLALLSLIVEVLSKQFRTVNKSILHKSGLWRQLESNEEFQTRLDAYVADLNRRQSPEEFSTSLPRPLRLSLAEINRLSTTFLGKLVLETSYDKHDFNIGLKRKSVLFEALREGGFIDNQ